MNTDKIYAEQIANDYAEKETSNIVIVVGHKKLKKLRETENISQEIELVEVEQKDS